ncbi:MAG: DUF2950 domain-containing protein [Blastocatellia bacterium]|nr:DUF2950 domain-containing protein [Blastocatellia bacterium]
MKIRKSNTLTAFPTANLLRGAALLALVCLLLAPGRALAQDPAQDTYDSVDAAVAAFTGVFDTGEREPLRKVLGPALATFTSGDEVQDKTELKRLDKAVKERVRTVMIDKKRAVLYIGALNWPFPIPLVQNAAGKWYFDTVAGREEYLNRRIGRNELSTMATLHAVAKAQLEYANEDRDGDGIIEYAQKFVSTPGSKDGLHWTVAEGEPKSPVGDLVATLRDEGYGAEAKSYRGYRFALLLKQGPAAIGGAKEYLVDGNLVRGFAIVAWPVSWGSSGIMTFMIGPDGRVFEKNLGPKTAELAPALDTFNPDKSWKLSVE